MQKFTTTTTTTLLATLLLTPLTTNAEIIVGIDDPINPGSTINTDITDDNGNPIDIHTIPNNTNLAIGYNANANLLLNNGSTLSTEKTYLGKNTNATGTLTLQDNNTHWTNTNKIVIAEQGQGTLNINSGASVLTQSIVIATTNSAVGIINLNNPNSQLNITENIYIGQAGQATLNIKNGATSTARNAYIGIIPSTPRKTPDSISNTSSATVNIQDLNSTWSILDNLHIGGIKSQATLNIKNGGTLNSRNSYVGGNAGSISTINIQDPNSNWTTSNLYVGDKGQGILNIKNGATLNSNSAIIGRGTSSNGTINIQDPNSNWTTSNLSLGYEGQGTLNINNGAKTTINDNLIIGERNTANGTVNIQDKNSNLTAESILIGHEGNALVNVSNSATINTDRLTLGSEPQGRKVPNKSAKKTIPSTLATTPNTATLNIKNSGTTITTNNMTIGSGLLSNLNISDQAQLIIQNDLLIYDSNNTTLNLSPTNTTDAPLISIGNIATLHGTLNILTDNLQNLTYNDTFTLLEIGGQSGQFQNLTEGDTAATHQGYDLILSYQGGDGNDITLTAIPEPTTIFTLLTLAPLTLTRRKNHRSAVAE